MKPVNGVGNGPVSGHFTIDKTEYFKEVGIPFSRTQDTEGMMGGGEYINIHCIFPDFDADPEKPKSYNFKCTDLYLKAIRNAGTDVFYRLGETIENGPHRIHVRLPKDFLKWAHICAGIIRHYNDGWAEGFHVGIKYWEIWNETDNPRMWIGENEGFFEL